MTVHARVLAPLLAACLSAACTAEVSAIRDVGDESDVEAALRAQFNSAIKPILDGACGSCHNNPSRGDAPDFMSTDVGHAETYDQVVEWTAGNGEPLVDVNNVGNSYLLRKGAHNGARAFGTEEIDSILRWIQAESDYATTVEFFQTEGIDLAFNANAIDLGDVGLEVVAGTRLLFDYNSDDTVLYFNNLRVEAGPAGVFLKHPIIVPLIDGVPVLEPLPRFDTVMLDLAPGAIGDIGLGSEAIAHLAEVYTPARTLQIAFYFEELRPQ